MKKKAFDYSKMTCEYCGVVKYEVMFAIGASLGPDWCMHEGTGKISCPGCHETALAEAQAVIEKATGISK